MTGFESCRQKRRRGIEAAANFVSVLSVFLFLLSCSYCCCSFRFVDAFYSPLQQYRQKQKQWSWKNSQLLAALSPNDRPNRFEPSALSEDSSNLSRRNWLSRVPRNLGIATATAALAASITFPSYASDGAIAGVVTDKVFVEIAGLSTSASAETSKTQRVVLGLFEADAPSSVMKLKALHSTAGLGAPCKPLKEDFLIQREQLEANKIYRSCTETQDRGVTYEYAQIWRIIKDERIDFGSLSGKYVAREFPTWAEPAGSAKSPSEYLSSSDTKYLVAVRKGSESGFGYTIFPTATAGSNQDFLDNYLVVGKVLEGEDVVSRINEVSVVNSAKVNYMAIVGGGGSKSNAPNRSCRYGGPMYCNENKPLTKLTMFRTGNL